MGEESMPRVSSFALVKTETDIRRNPVNITKLLAATAAIAIVASAASARDQIRIVGSSTVFPFSTAVAEQFGKTTDFATPVVNRPGRAAA